MGDALEDFILFRAILKVNQDFQISYIGPPYANELARLTKIKNISIYPVDKTKLYKISNYKNLLRCPLYPDLVYIFPGMNLKKSILFKYIYKPKKFVGALQDYPLKNMVHLIPKHLFYDSIHYGKKNLHRLETNKSYLSNYFEIAPLDLNILNFDEINKVDHEGVLMFKYDYMVINVGSSQKFPLRSFSLFKWVELINSILDNVDLNIVFIGNAEERTVVDHIINKIDQANRKRVKNYANLTTIKKLFQIIYNSQIVISIDSGPGHIAGIMGKKQIMFFGPTNHSFANPINPNCIKIFREIKCSPCYLSDKYYNCPYNNECMDDISVDTVINAISLIANDDFNFAKINGDFVNRCSTRSI